MFGQRRNQLDLLNRLYEMTVNGVEDSVADDEVKIDLLRKSSEIFSMALPKPDTAFVDRFISDEFGHCPSCTKEEFEPKEKNEKRSIFKRP